MSVVYRDKALSQVPRILGLIDRDESSKNYGCCDRYYWHYRFHDFSNARFQEVSLLLALLFKYNFEDNPFFGNKKILSWALGAIKFWERIRNKDGSVNEAYPFERSFCATSLSTFAITEAMLILGINEPIELKTTGLWLKRNNNINVANQMAGSAISLFNIYLLTGDTIFKEASEKKIEFLIKNQNSDGYFLEYGGMDIGYQSLTLSLLVRYYKKAKSTLVFESLEKGIRALEKVILNDGSFDYSMTSRKTQFLYPYCFIMPNNNIIDKHITGLKENKVLEPGWLDDRYVVPLTTDYLHFYLESKNAYDNA